MNINVQSSPSTVRLYYFDEAKAFAIFLIILGHMPLPSKFMMYICSFHVPLFFLVSGFFFKKQTLSKELIKIIRTLIIPYLYFSLINLSYSICVAYFHPEKYYVDSSFQILSHGLLGIIRGENIIDQFSYIPYGPLWFLLSLSIIRLLFQGFLNYFKSNLYFIIFSSVIVGFIFVLCRYFDFRVLSIMPALLSFPFFLAGYFFKYYLYIFDDRSLRLKILSIMFFVFFLSYCNGLVNVNLLSYGNSLLLFLFFGFNNSLFIVLLFRAFPTIRLVEFLGRYSLFILGYSGLILFLISSIVIVLIGKQFLSNPFYIVSVAIITTLIGGYLGLVTLNSFPSLFGKTQTK